MNTKKYDSSTDLLCLYFCHPGIIPSQYIEIPISALFFFFVFFLFSFKSLTRKTAVAAFLSQLVRIIVTRVMQIAIKA